MSRRMRRPFLALLLLLSTTEAFAADVATRADAPADPPDRRWLVATHARYTTVPDFVLASLFRAHRSMEGYTVGVSALWRRPGAGEWWFGLDYLRLAFAPGNWLEESLPTGSTVHLAWDLGFLSAAAGYTWRFGLLDDRLYLGVGVGAALGVFLGDVEAIDAVPTCEAPVATCPHWRRATRRALALPTRVLPVPVAFGTVDVRLWRELWLRLDAGLYGLPYAGGSLAYTVF